MHDYNILEQGVPLELAEKAIIMLHGRGGTAGNIISLAKEFAGNNFYIAAPQATNNTWYPYSFLAPEDVNEPWLTSAVGVVKKLIDEVASVTSTGNIYIMGFSQGACLALETASRFADKYAGVVGFTGGLIGETIDSSKYKGLFMGTKVFIGNSDIDPHVPVERSMQTRDTMEQLGADVRLSIYPGMAHTVTSDEIEEVKEMMGL